MSTKQHHSLPRDEASNASLRSYAIGFGLSLILTLSAYWLATHPTALTTHATIAIVVGLALLQFTVQLLFFLHLDRETKPRWKLFVFLFMLMVVVILVFGSLWIMDNLNYRMTAPQINSYMNNQGGGF